MQQDGVTSVRSRIARVQELLVTLLIRFQPLYSAHREAIGHGNNRQFVLAQAFAIHRDGRARRALVERIFKRRLQFVSKLLQTFVFIR